jgi:hypothetical protein
MNFDLGISTTVVLVDVVLSGIGGAGESSCSIGTLVVKQKLQKGK